MLVGETSSTRSVVGHHDTNFASSTSSFSWLKEKEAASSCSFVMPNREKRNSIKKVSSKQKKNKEGDFLYTHGTFDCLMLKCEERELQNTIQLKLYVYYIYSNRTGYSLDLPLAASTNAFEVNNSLICSDPIPNSFRMSIEFSPTVRNGGLSSLLTAGFFAGVLDS